MADWACMAGRCKRRQAVHGVGEERAMVPKHGVLEHWLALQPGCKTNYLEERKQYMKPREPGSPSIVNQMSAGGSREPWTAWAEGIWWPANFEGKKEDGDVQEDMFPNLSPHLQRTHCTSILFEETAHVNSLKRPGGYCGYLHLQTKKPKYERCKTM